MNSEVRWDCMEELVEDRAMAENIVFSRTGEIKECLILSVVIPPRGSLYRIAVSPSNDYGLRFPPTPI